MTKNQDAIRIIKAAIAEVEWEYPMEYAVAFDRAIEVLEQESILDKIKAEIADLDDANYDYEGYYKAVTDAVKIIDKYKAESEGKE